jgi:hypothetical protein
VNVSAYSPWQADPGRTPVGPGTLDQGTPDTPIAGFGNPEPAYAVAGSALPRPESQVTHELARIINRRRSPISTMIVAAVTSWIPRGTCNASTTAAVTKSARTPRALR